MSGMCGSTVAAGWTTLLLLIIFVSWFFLYLKHATTWILHSVLMLD